MWKKKEITLGRVKAKTPINLEFEYLGNEIFKEAKASCGCTVPIWDERNKKIKVTFTPNSVSPHLTGQNIREYNTEKHITVSMMNLQSVITEYILKIKGIVYE